MNADALIESARETLAIESTSLLRAQENINTDFARAVELLLAVRGRIIVMGMGKSGHIGRKIAATLASTGSPSFFVHPAEASHGDLGMLTQEDGVLAISNSGESEELITILPFIKRIGVPLISITGGLESNLARFSKIVLDSSVAQEACPLNLAPTASTTVQLALGDALAVALLKARGFGQEDFARSHPGGSLGRKLLTLVSDVMRTNHEIPRVHMETQVREMMVEMSKKGLGVSAVVDDNNTVQGIFTDGDLRRLLEHIEQGVDILQLPASKVMHPKPYAVSARDLAVDAAVLMEGKSISSVLVVDDAMQLIGIVSAHDLMRAKVI